MPLFSTDPSLSAEARGPLPPGRALRRLERWLYAYAALKDLVLLYPVYALLFAGHGLSTGQISSLFVIWSVTGVVAEVPSGVWADTVSRRSALVAGALLTGAGFGLWVAVPSYAAFAAGFALWGLGGALGSGALEALVYEELEQLGATDRYAGLTGRAAAVATVATAVATAAAAPVFAAGGFTALGAASTAACLLCAGAAAALPERRGGPARFADDGEDDGEAAGGGAGVGYGATLRAGLGEVRRIPAVRYAVLAVIVLTTVWGSLDEYVPLLAAATGTAVGDVPLLVLVVYAGVAVGGVLAGRARRWGAGATAGLLAGAALLMAVGALSGSPFGFALLAPAFLVFQLTDVVADARLQESLTGRARATVTSLAGLGTELTTLLVYGLYGAASGHADHGTLFALFAVPYVVFAAALAVRAQRGGP
ncbi:MFS transporter [Streptomyces tsukubensis]|uniref:MFS transporter n=1 Tax=Streptomyces tsukubensis TaxID=83656 RepID=UPI001E4E4187|nr:MFS transporter [Streptomyces tsukubensis]